MNRLEVKVKALHRECLIFKHFYATERHLTMGDRNQLRAKIVILVEYTSKTHLEIAEAVENPTVSSST